MNRPHDLSVLDRVRRLLAARPARALAWAALAGATGLLVRAEVVRPDLPAGVRVWADLTYRQAGVRRARLDVYRPDGPAPTGGWPALVAVHGGGWRGGSKGEYGRDLARRLVPHGLAVVAVDYRLSRPGAPAWPDNADDVREAVRWTRRNAQRFAIDPDRLALTGASAGGHLALVAGLDPSLRGAVRAVIDFYGPTGLRALRAARAATGEPVDLLLGGPPDALPGRYDDASPLRLVAPGAPPVLILHGTDDPLVPLEQSRALDEALARAGVPHRLVVVDGARHGFGVWVGGDTPRDLGPEILAFLRGCWKDR